MDNSGSRIRKAIKAPGVGKSSCGVTATAQAQLHDVQSMHLKELAIATTLSPALCIRISTHSELGLGKLRHSMRV